MNAVLKVRHAGPYVSVQDGGRFGYKRYGVTGSGAMDRFSHHLANSALMRPVESAAIEVSLGGVQLECVSGSVTVAIAGGSFNILHDGVKQAPCSAHTLQPGSTLSIRPGDWGSWCYLAIAGQIESPSWLGSQSVHLNSGLCGRPLQTDDTIEIHQPQANPQLNGIFLEASILHPDKTLRAVLGPQDQYFDQPSIEAFFSSRFTITADYNRMGVRLSGPTLNIPVALDMPSEAIARGSLQVPGHGDPIMLMADHQSTGGYPKIATVISCDQDKFAQLRSGDSISFEQLEVTEAIEAARDEHDKRQNIFEQVALNSVCLEERLARSNLISGVTDASAAAS